MATIHDNLASALADMRWRIEPGTFTLLGFSEAPTPEDFALLSAPPAQIIVEEGETSLLIPSERAEEALLRHPGADTEQDLLWVRFEAPMNWDVVGFLALVTGQLAAAGVPIGAVCGFHRDHLFLARQHEASARAVLAEVLPNR